VTTIAWDGRTLAADRQANSNGSRRRVHKIIDCGAFWYGSCGQMDEIARVAEWLSQMEEPPPVFDGCNLYGIVVRKCDACAFFVEGKTVCLAPILDRVMATGSGGEYARAAMELGKTAAQAVEFAARFDLGTGLGVDSVQVLRHRRGQRAPGTR
jgi:hypothetical protein